MNSSARRWSRIVPLNDPLFDTDLAPRIAIPFFGILQSPSTMAGAVGRPFQNPKVSCDGQRSRRQRHGAASGFLFFASVGRHILPAILRDAGRHIVSIALMISRSG